MPAEKISITLTDHMVRDVKEAVRTGEFASTSEVMRDAVRVWRRQRLEDVERLETIRARVRRAIDDPRPDLDEDDIDRKLVDLHGHSVKAHRGEKA